MNNIPYENIGNQILTYVRHGIVRLIGPNISGTAIICVAAQKDGRRTPLALTYEEYARQVHRLGREPRRGDAVAWSEDGCKVTFPYIASAIPA